jgi:hypothetical protein
LASAAGGGETAQRAATAAARNTPTNSALTSIGIVTALVLAGGGCLALVIRRVARIRAGG